MKVIEGVVISEDVLKRIELVFNGVDKLADLVTRIVEENVTLRRRVDDLERRVESLGRIH